MSFLRFFSYLVFSGNSCMPLSNSWFLSNFDVFSNVQLFFETLGILGSSLEYLLLAVCIGRGGMVLGCRGMLGVRASNLKPLSRREIRIF